MVVSRIAKKIESASKIANDREILELFFLHHNLTPTYFGSRSEAGREKQVRHGFARLYCVYITLI